MVEHVVEHEGEPFGGSECLEHDEQGETDRVGEKSFLLRVDVVVAVWECRGCVLDVFDMFGVIFQGTLRVSTSVSAACPGKRARQLL